MKIIYTNNSDPTKQKVEYVSSKKLQDKFHRDIEKLIQNNKAKFYGRSLNNENNRVYQIFSINDKKILIEDLKATEILKTLFDQDGIIRQFEVSK